VWCGGGCVALRPLVVGIGLVLIQQFSGINAVMFNTGALFAEKDAKVITTEYAVSCEL
jgi:hypothetical protein